MQVSDNTTSSAAEDGTKLPVATNAVIETVQENLEKQSLNAEQVTDYCRKLFQFKNIRVMRFK